jgi:hypothetical protein
MLEQPAEGQHGGADAGLQPGRVHAIGLPAQARLATQLVGHTGYARAGADRRSGRGALADSFGEVAMARVKPRANRPYAAR